MTEGGPERIERGCRVSFRPLVPAVSPISLVVITISPKRSPVKSLPAQTLLYAPASPTQR